MRIKDLPIRWILLGLIVLPIGAYRIRLALQSTEESIRGRIEFLSDALEARQAKRIRRAVSRDFVDESSNSTRRDIVDAARYLTMGSTRYRATLDPEDGIQFLSPPEDGVKAVTVRVHCLLESREGESEYRPWWDVEVTLDLEKRDGSWKVVAARDVNHDDRPRTF